MVKKKLVGENLTAGFSKVLLYICQPCLAVYTFSSATFSREILFDMCMFLCAAVAIHAIMLGAACLILKKKFREVSSRIFTIASSFANCAFFGIPIIRALMPESADSLIIFTTVYALIMNILGWTVGSAIISGDSRYISIKKIFINPAFLGTLVAIPIFVFSVPMEGSLGEMVINLGLMTTPLSMIIMGMRLATTSPRAVFLDYRSYIAVFAKSIVMPLVGFFVVYFLPLPVEVKKTFFIICACPTASIVLNFSELIGEGQKEAAASVLLSTILSIVTLPVMVLMLPLL